MIWVWALAKRALRKMSKHISEERYDEWTLWLVAKMWRHEDRVNRAFGVEPAQITRGPRPIARLQQPTTTAGAGTITYTRNFQP